MSIFILHLRARVLVSSRKISALEMSVFLFSELLVSAQVNALWIRTFTFSHNASIAFHDQSRGETKFHLSCISKFDHAKASQSSFVAAFVMCGY